MEKMGTLKKNGDQKINFGPHGDQSPQMGTNVGAVYFAHCLSAALFFVNIKSDATFSENLFVNQDVTISNDLFVNNNSQINGNLVTSTGIVNKDLTVLGSVYVDKDVSFNIDLSVNSTLYCYNLDVCGEILAKNGFRRPQGVWKAPGRSKKWGTRYKGPQTLHDF